MKQVIAIMNVCSYWVRQEAREMADGSEFGYTPALSEEDAREKGHMEDLEDLFDRPCLKCQACRESAQAALEGPPNEWFNG